jgi:hypothetical protein
MPPPPKPPPLSLTTTKYPEMKSQQTTVHDHKMTPEFQTDLGHLEQALKLLEKMSLTQQCGVNNIVATFKKFIDDLKKEAGIASAAIGTLRENIQELSKKPKPDVGSEDYELGLWALGFGLVPLKGTSKLSIKHRDAVQVGKDVTKFFKRLTQTVTQPSGQKEILLRSLLVCVIAEGENANPRWDKTLLDGLQHIVDKIDNRMAGSFAVANQDVANQDARDQDVGDPDAGALTPQYYWPNTYVSSSSSSGFSSSSTWPPRS